MTIRLKCWAPSFDAIASGRKKVELRRTDDRTFSVGDVLCLVRTAPDGSPSPGGGWIRARVTWIDTTAGPLQLLGTTDIDGGTACELAALSIDLLETGTGAPPE
jgi:uncharacterized protein DUF3850